MTLNEIESSIVALSFVILTRRADRVSSISRVSASSTLIALENSGELVSSESDSP